MFYNQKKKNAVLFKKKNEKEKKKGEKVLNYKLIFLRSKDLLLSVVIFNLKGWLSVAS